MTDAIIVGGGLFGQIIAKRLRTDGRDVMVIDSERAFAGSKPAACLMKPSWFSSMGREIYEPALELLEELYGVKDIQFTLRPTSRPATVHWCNPRDILSAPRVIGEVVHVAPGQVRVNLRDIDGETILEAPLIVVAAGIWTEYLLPQYPQLGQMGAAFLWQDTFLHRPFIQPWAPYKQIVGFNRGDGMWVGDGTAIKMENWTTERQDASKERCWNATARSFLDKEPEVLLGVRPYARGHKPCLLEEVGKGLWVASGGAKNGTLAAAHAALTIARAS